MAERLQQFGAMCYTLHHLVSHKTRKYLLRNIDSHGYQTGTCGPL